MLMHRNGDESFSSETEKKREAKKGRNERELQSDCFYSVWPKICPFLPHHIFIFFWLPFVGAELHPSKMHTLRSWLQASQDVTVLAHRVFKGVNELKWVHYGGSVSVWRVVIKRGDSDTDKSQTQREAHVKTRATPTSQAEGSQKRSTLLTPWSWTSASRTSRKSMSII